MYFNPDQSFQECLTTFGGDTNVCSSETLPSSLPKEMKTISDLAGGGTIEWLWYYGTSIFYSAVITLLTIYLYITFLCSSGTTMNWITIGVAIGSLIFMFGIQVLMYTFRDTSLKESGPHFPVNHLPKALDFLTTIVDRREGEPLMWSSIFFAIFAIIILVMMSVSGLWAGSFLYPLSVLGTLSAMYGLTLWAKGSKWANALMMIVGTLGAGIVTLFFILSYVMSYSSESCS